MKKSRQPRSSKVNEPPLEHRLVFVQFIRRQRCRYNQSFNGFLELPDSIRNKVVTKWETAHPRMKLPEFEVSARPQPRRKKP